jgi:transposase
MVRHMLKTEQIKMSEYVNIYNVLIPTTHILRKLNDLIDFRFVEDELRSKYCLNNGRGAISPIRLFKYLLLKVLYNLSDRDLVERSRYDMSFKYFLEYQPEEDVISPSELTKFRKQRLTDEGILDKLLKKSVEIAIEKGVVSVKNNIIVDATHTTSRYNNRRADQVLSDQAKKLRKSVYAVDEGMRKKFPAKVEGSNIEEHTAYCEKLLDVIEKEEQLGIYESIRAERNLLREMIEDNLENIKQSADEDAKTGHKTADSSFYGYKTHIAMTEEGIISAAVVTSGEKPDGKQLATLVEKSKQAGIEVEAAIGDRAYSEQDNIDYAKDNFNLISRLHPGVTQGLRKPEDEFYFNKDAEMYVCKAGHMAISKTCRHNKQPERKENPRMVYYFDINKCKHCPNKEGCYKEGSKSKSYSVSISSETQNEHKDFQETESFKELASHRYKIEAKNGELKNRHGYGTAEASGIQSMRLQGATVLFCVNMKRIIKLMDNK